MEQQRSATEARRIGIMGGTFDPIHIAHLIIAEEVRTTLKLEEMVFMPAGNPPHKVGRVQTPAHHRLAMVERAIASNKHFSVTRVEIDREGPSYLVDTLGQLKAEWGAETQLYFVIGGDSLEEFPTWYKPEGILEQLTGLVAVQRPGYIEDPEYNTQLEARLPGLMARLCMVAAPLLEISSTDLRERIAEKRPIIYQVPEAVEQYISEHRLYEPTTSYTGSR